MNQYHFNKIKQLKDWERDLSAVLVFKNDMDEETRNDTIRYRDLLVYAIEQIERVQELKRFSISKDELKEVLNSNENIGELYQFVEDEHSIRDVFAIIVKEMGYLAGALGEYSESYFGLEQQNKRYRELLKKIKEMTRYDDCREAEIYELVSDELEGEE